MGGVGVVGVYWNRLTVKRFCVGTNLGVSEGRTMAGVHCPIHLTVTQSIDAVIYTVRRQKVWLRGPPGAINTFIWRK